MDEAALYGIAVQWLLCLTRDEWMFEFITISNGVAIVQHTAEGHVYRFNPVQRDKWDKLILTRLEANEAANTSADTFAAAALRFAERAAVECMRG